MSEESATKARLIEAAKKEFLDKGYEKASLRKICAGADVTTGAMYFFFKNKQDLFTSVVSEKAEHLLKLVKRQTDSEVNGVGNSEEYQREMNEYLCSNKDEVRILLDKSAGTAYENFREEYCSEVARGFFAFYDKFGGSEEYRDIMKLIVRMRVQGYIEMLKGDYDMDKMMKFSALMEVYGDSGFQGMMKQFKVITKGTE
ncbi:MAG: TetR/AcrR family transcriptional regulator [Oscillospiraceae bacterium]|nr:TetR/AcrR family transcriptional regulator [Oscillospiraceae bacterium]